MKYYHKCVNQEALCGNVSFQFFADLVPLLSEGEEENDELFKNKIIQEILSADNENGENEEENEIFIVLLIVFCLRMVAVRNASAFGKKVFERKRVAGTAWKRGIYKDSYPGPSLGEEF